MTKIFSRLMSSKESLIEFVSILVMSFIWGTFFTIKFSFYRNHVVRKAGIEPATNFV